MPQMSPINWLSLYFMFFIVFIMFNIMNYYLFNSNAPKSLFVNKNKMENSLNWKW